MVYSINPPFWGVSNQKEIRILKPLFYSLKENPSFSANLKITSKARCRLKGCLVCKALKKPMELQLFPYLRCWGILQMDYRVKLREKDVKLSKGVENWTLVYSVGVQSANHYTVQGHHSRFLVDKKKHFFLNVYLKNYSQPYIYTPGKSNRPILLQYSQNHKDYNWHVFFLLQGMSKLMGNSWRSNYWEINIQTELQSS